MSGHRTCRCGPTSVRGQWWTNCLSPGLRAGRCIRSATTNGSACWRKPEAGWPPDESPGADAVEEEVADMVRGRGKGQGPGLTSAERALVESRAMEVATRH